MSYGLDPKLLNASYCWHEVKKEKSGVDAKLVIKRPNEIVIRKTSVGII